MALVTFVMIEGHRREIDRRQMVYEHRCDGCGEFITGAPVQLLATISYAGAQHPGRPLDLHLQPGCVDAGFAKLAADIHQLQGEGR